MPEGALSLVPFAALPVGQRWYILDTGRVIHYLSAERDLVPMPQVPATRRGLVALGGPSFDDGSLFEAEAKAKPSSAYRSCRRYAVKMRRRAAVFNRPRSSRSTAPFTKCATSLASGRPTHD